MTINDAAPAIERQDAPAPAHPRPRRVPEQLYTSLGYLLTRLVFLNTRYAPQVHWGDVAVALHDFPAEKVDPSRADFWEEWKRRWSECGYSYRDVAGNSSTVAGRSRALNSAAACFHWAEFMCFDDPDEKLRLRRMVRDCFLSSLDETDIELHQRELAATAEHPAVGYWIVLPPARKRADAPLPAVLVSNGLDSMTEIEGLGLAEAYLERGIAVILFDGPGQGIQVGQTPLRAEMESVVSALVAELRGEPDIDTSRLAFLGVSFGGYIALRVGQSLGSAFRCVVNFGGGPRIREFANLPRRLKENFRFVFRADPDEDMQSRFDALKLDPASAPGTEVLSVHGELDDIFPESALGELDERWGTRHHLKLYEAEAHTCLNVLNTYTLKAADWVAERLGAAAVQP